VDTGAVVLQRVAHQPPGTVRHRAVKLRASPVRLNDTNPGVPTDPHGKGFIGQASATSMLTVATAWPRPVGLGASFAIQPTARRRRHLQDNTNGGESCAEYNASTGKYGPEVRLRTPQRSTRAAQDHRHRTHGVHRLIGTALHKLVVRRAAGSAA